MESEEMARSQLDDMRNKAASFATERDDIHHVQKQMHKLKQKYDIMKEKIALIKYFEHPEEEDQEFAELKNVFTTSNDKLQFFIAMHNRLREERGAIKGVELSKERWRKSAAELRTVNSHLSAQLQQLQQEQQQNLEKSYLGRRQQLGTKHDNDSKKDGDWRRLKESFDLHQRKPRKSRHADHHVCVNQSSQEPDLSRRKRPRLTEIADNIPASTSTVQRPRSAQLQDSIVTPSFQSNHYVIADGEYFYEDESRADVRSGVGLSDKENTSPPSSPFNEKDHPFGESTLYLAMSDMETATQEANSGAKNVLCEEAEITENNNHPDGPTDITSPSSFSQEENSNLTSLSGPCTVKMGTRLFDEDDGDDSFPLEFPERTGEETQVPSFVMMTQDDGPNVIGQDLQLTTEDQKCNDDKPCNGAYFSMIVSHPDDELSEFQKAVLIRELPNLDGSASGPSTVNNSLTDTSAITHTDASSIAICCCNTREPHAEEAANQLVGGQADDVTSSITRENKPVGFRALGMLPDECLGSSCGTSPAPSLILLSPGQHEEEEEEELSPILCSDLAQRLANRYQQKNNSSMDSLLAGQLRHRLGISSTKASISEIDCTSGVQKAHQKAISSSSSQLPSLMGWLASSKNEQIDSNKAIADTSSSSSALTRVQSQKRAIARRGKKNNANVIPWFLP